RRASPRTPASPGGERTGKAFAGLRVADFTWVAAGPMTAKALADHGATVVKIESSTRLDLVRSLPPFKDNIPGANRSHWLSNVNSSKLSLSLNLRTDRGRALARRMIDWADVVIEAFTPGTMARLGLDYDAVSANRDDLIWMSTCLLGQTGPRAAFAGYGSHGAALSGLIAITGWPDRAPVGPAGPYTDVITPRFGVPVLTAAILERRRSGRGQYIDLSQVEGALHMIEPLLLDQSVNGRTAPPAGHDSPTSAPHGVYAAAGVERYVAIAVETTAQWRALRVLAPLDTFADARFGALDARREACDAIDAALRTWTATLPPTVLEARLTSAGVPAARVQRMSDLYADPQLAHREFFVTFDHPEIGRHPYDGLVTRFSAKREQLHTRAPLLGEHTERVLRDLLGLEPEEIADAAAAGALA
ncbi:MAG: CoA transferase, partial [Chloroflexi bacterium]|nr:CoA transferase [Chloroflexota bacterium]